MQTKLKIIVTLSVLGAIVSVLGVPVMWKVWFLGFYALVVGVLAYRALTYSIRSSVSRFRKEGQVSFAEKRPDDSEKPQEVADNSNAT